MVTATDIGWGEYDGWEGPFFQGRLHLQTPDTPDLLDRFLAVVTATESGKYDAVNMYDSCVVSVGVIQWCERLHLLGDKILSKCAALQPDKLNSFFQNLDLTFERKPGGNYRFKLSGQWVDTVELQRAAFLGGAAIGKKGTWTSAARDRAKCVAACMANIWTVPEFQQIQLDVTKSSLLGFVLPEAKAYLFPASDDLWHQAMQALYLSFAANNPALAGRGLAAARAHEGFEQAAPAARFNILAATLACGSGIRIYPLRYKAIAPVISKYFVEVPRTAEQLQSLVSHPTVEVTSQDVETALVFNRLSENLQLSLVGGLDGIDAIDAVQSLEDSGPK